jgi:DNA-binding Xre family transcriptional regulator
MWVGVNYIQQNFESVPTRNFGQAFLRANTEKAYEGLCYVPIWGKIRLMATRPVTEFDRAVSAYIRATAAAKKMGQDETAEHAGIHVNTFRRYWRGERSISLSDLRTILSALDVRTDVAVREIERIFKSGNYAS